MPRLDNCISGPNREGIPCTKSSTEAEAEATPQDGTLPKVDIWAYLEVFPLTAWLIGLVILVVFGALVAIASHESLSQVQYPI